jgi:dihydrolipoyl dehydrogenase
MSQYDLVIIGAGPGGYPAAIRAGQRGLRTAIVEKGAIGGVCLNEGCIPSKALIHAAESYHALGEMKSFGVSVSGAALDWGKAVAWKDRIVKRLTTGVATLLKTAGVEVIAGHARFVDEHTIAVETTAGERRLTTKHTIIATGSRAAQVPTLPFDGKMVLSAREALALEEVPERLIVVGGGYIGLELGTMFAMAGTKVTVVEWLDGLLPGQPRDAVKVLDRTLRRLKIKTHLRTKAEKLEIEDGVATLTVTGPDGEAKELEADKILVTVGRRPTTEDLGLENVGIEPNRQGQIEVNAQRRTANEAIYAIGDVAPGPMLAHKATAEALVAVAAILGEDVAFDDRVVPGVVFTSPEVATVGLTEEQAAAEDFDTAAATFPLMALGRALTMGTTDGYLKWVYRTADQVIVGAEAVGRGASNLISEAALAVEKGLTLSDIGETIHPHPTLGEGWHEAAELGLGFPIHVPKS